MHAVYQLGTRIAYSLAVAMTGATLSLYVRARDRRAIDQVRAELAAQRGNVSHAARALGIAHRTLRRWVVALDLQAELDRLRQSREL